MSGAAKESSGDDAMVMGGGEQVSKISWRGVLSSERRLHASVGCARCVLTAWRETQHLPEACRKPGGKEEADTELRRFENPTCRAD